MFTALSTGKYVIRHIALTNVSYNEIKILYERI
jgi:hypothetical protein